MAGFGGGKAKKPKETPPKLTSGESVARTSLKEYNQIKRAGGTVAKVHARLKGTEEWFPVGSVCTEAGKTAEGTQGQKRLILEHAAEMYDQMRSGAGVTLVLEAGYSSEPGGDIVVCKAKYSGEAVGVALDPLPSGPFFRDVGTAGFAKDSSSAATLMDKAKYV
eukprot:jgi/Undpi1/465/HiC_scaffold_1.g00461.m1